ncbi:MAG: hypothetical protein AB7E84_06355 [Xanthobacteraceae bacterium]
MPRSAELPQELRAIAETNNGKMVSAIMRAVAPHIKELRDKIAALEARPVPKFVGPFRQGQAYRELSFCVHAGSLWVCKSDTVLKPGQSSDWQLVAKRGDYR